MDGDDHTNLFETLPNVFSLVTQMAEVTFSFVANSLTQQSSITIKNLLIDSYINNLPEQTKNIVTVNRPIFKDWLAEQLALQLTNCTIKQCRFQKEQSSDFLNLTKTPITLQPIINNKRILPISTVIVPTLTKVVNTHTNYPSKQLRKYTYATEVIEFTVFSSFKMFETAALMFNKQFICNACPKSKIIKKDRYRRNKSCSAQTYKCNCCTTDVVLQFRCFNPEQLDKQNYNVKIFIKSIVLEQFNLHFSQLS